MTLREQISKIIIALGLMRSYAMSGRGFTDKDNEIVAEAEDAILLLSRITWDAMLSTRPALSEGPPRNIVSADAETSFLAWEKKHGWVWRSEAERQGCITAYSAGWIAAARPALSTESGWLDIATAPKDGTLIVLCSTQYVSPGSQWEPEVVHQPRAELGRWDSTGTSWVDEHGSLGGFDDLAVTGVWLSGGGWFQPNEITHWMPLPTPPTETER